MLLFSFGETNSVCQHCRGSRRSNLPLKKCHISTSWRFEESNALTHEKHTSSCRLVLRVSSSETTMLALRKTHTTNFEKLLAFNILRCRPVLSSRKPFVKAALRSKASQDSVCENLLAACSKGSVVLNPAYKIKVQTCAASPNYTEKCRVQRAVQGWERWFAWCTYGVCGSKNYYNNIQVMALNKSEALHAHTLYRQMREGSDLSKRAHRTSAMRSHHIDSSTLGDWCSRHSTPHITIGNRK